MMLSALKKVFLGVVAASLVFSCSNPEILGLPSPGTLTFTLAAPSDFPADFAFDTVEAVASCEGYSSIKLTQSTLTKEASFTNLHAGTWTVTAEAYTGVKNSKLTYLSGTSTITVGATGAKITIPLTQTRVTPVYASISAGTVAKGDIVQLTCDTVGAEIHYTLDGTEPTITSPTPQVIGQAQNAIALNTAGSVLLKAKSFKDALEASSTLAVNYTVISGNTTLTATAPVITVNSTAKTIAIQATAGAVIYYTTDGTDPTVASATYSSALTGLTSGSVKAFAMETGKNNSSIVTQIFDFSSVVQYSAAPILNYDAVAKTVTITAAAGASIYYTVDGTTPTSASAKYSTAIVLADGSTTVKAIAVETGKQPSGVTSNTYTNTSVSTAPSIAQVGTTNQVNITAATGAKVYYTVDGSEPSVNSTVYSAAITIPAGTTTIKAIAIETGKIKSPVITKTVTFTEVIVETVADVTMAPASATILTTDTVTLVTATSGATVYYTLDGSDPLSSATKITYSAPFALTAGSKTVKAAAIKAGWTNSAVTSKTYTVTSTVKVPTSVTLSADKTNVAPSAVVTFTSAVLDQDGTAMAGQTVTLYNGTALMTGTTFTTATEGTYTFTAKSGNLVSSAVTVNVKKVIVNAHYSTNPNGQVGKAKTGMNVTCTSTLSDSFSDWTADMLIAQGAAYDDAKSFFGNHEYPSYDSYSLYATWDDTNLYLGWQFVYVNDIMGNNGANEARPTNGDIPQMLAFDIDPTKGGIGTMANGKNLWYDKSPTGFNFDKSLSVDKIAMFSSKGGVGQPSLFSVGADGFFDYALATGFKIGGIVYGAIYGLLPEKVWGVKKSSGYVPADLNINADWVDFTTLGHAKTQDTFYEMKIPLATLGITRSQLETKGIGIMHISIYGTSGVDSLPVDKAATLDNAMKPYSMDTSSSNEKEDLDVFTVPLARIGHL